MLLVARASKWFCGKNLLLVLMCAGACGMFAYDGWIGWPNRDDRLVKWMIERAGQEDPAKSAIVKYLPELHGWDAKTPSGWDASSPAQRNQMTDIAKEVVVEGWKSPTDIMVQKYIVAGLLLAVAVTTYRFVKFARARAIADDKSISPAPGITIPWEKITLVDNTRWKGGLVEITYTDEKGDAKKATFDDYELNREKLLPILDLLAEKAWRAEFLPKENSPKPAPEPAPTTDLTHDDPTTPNSD